MFLVLSSCSVYKSTSAEIIGEWKLSDGYVYVTDACIGEINGKPYLFVMTMTSALSKAIIHVLDVENPSEPMEVASLETPIEILIPLGGLALSETELYVTLTGSNEAAVWVLDISDPEFPREIALMDITYAVWRPHISGDILAVATDLRGYFTFFDISRPSQPQWLGELEFAQHLEGYIAWYADYVGSMFYVVNTDGLTIVDVSSPASPQELSYHTNPDWEPVEREGVEGLGTDVLIMTEEFTVEDLIDNVAPSGSYLDVAVSGDYAYIAASDSGLVVLDISDSTSPSEVARLEVPDRPRRIIISGNLVFLIGFRVPDDETWREMVHWMHPLHIVDITNPVTPRLVDSVEEITGVTPCQLMVTFDDYIYFLNHQAVYVIDIYGGHR